MRLGFTAVARRAARFVVVVDGSKLVGPTWLGVYGSQETMTDGSVVTVDEAYIRESILDPNKLVVQGYAPGLMPANFGELLTDEIIADIIAFMKSLR